MRQILAALAVERRQRLDLLQHARREHIGNAMRVHGDEADLALVRRIAEALDDARDGQAAASAPGNVEAHELAVCGLARIACLDTPFAQLLAVDRQDRAAALALRDRCRAAASARARAS